MKNFSSKLTLPQKTIEVVCAAVLLVMVLGPIIFWGRLPDQIPGHFNGAGEIDRWASKWELLLMPMFSVFMYALLSAACWLIGESVRKGELPRSAYTWITGTKLVTIGNFAVIEWHSALARPMGTWLLPVVIALLAVLITGFLISALQFARNQKKE